jgi:GT2 family glycosyltransferase
MIHSSPLGVVIVSYNTCEFLRGSLLALKRLSDEGPFDIVVVDNGSTDGSVQMVADDFPEVRLIALEENVGFAQANNHAVEELSNSEILFLNPDTVLTRGAIERLRKHLDAHPNAAVVGGQLVIENGDPQPSSFAFPTLWREFWSYLPELKGFFHFRALASRLSLMLPGLWRGSYRWDPEIRQVDSVAGACMIIRADAFRKLGGFRKEFFLYHEEMELCYRLRRQGWEVWLEPRARVLHYEGQASGTRRFHLAPTHILRYRLKGMDYFWSVHRSRFSYVVWGLMVRSILRFRAFLCWSSRLLAGRDARKRLRQRSAELWQIAGELKSKVRRLDS